MRYYLYISDSKVDMLFAQIPSKLRDKIAFELRVDIKVVSVSLKDRPNDETRYSKLEVVEKYIGDNLTVGSVDEPEEFFTGLLPVRWRPGENLVYFTGTTKRTFLGLGGSSHHVLGSAPTPESGVRLASVLPYMRSVIQKDVDESLKGMLSPQLEGRDNYLGAFLKLSEILESMTMPEQRVRFLAKRLLDEPFPINYRSTSGKPVDSNLKRVLIGSPIYVALAE